MLLQSIKRNKITALLLLTVLLGAFYQLVLMDELTTDRITHLFGKIGMSEKWHVYFIFRYLIGFTLVTSLLFPVTQIDRDAIISYLCWDVYGFISYLCFGWPEPVASIIFGYLIGLAIFIIIRSWKFN